MTKQEFQKRIGAEISQKDYSIVEHVYTWHPSISEVEGKEQMSCILELLLMMNAETTSTLSSLPEMITRMSADLIMSEKYGSSSMGGKKS